jgi:hypothetical protein
MLATIAGGNVSDMPKVATKELVQTTERAVHIGSLVKAPYLQNILKKTSPFI